jgi:GH25 family lysozyme M1 (1,4-beta-N-acetylmuramidase)
MRNWHVVIAGQGERSALYWEFSGPGLREWLHDAVVYPASKFTAVSEPLPADAQVIVGASPDGSGVQTGTTQSGGGTPTTTTVQPTSDGMDINSGQPNMNFATAKAEGIDFVIVKMGGANVLPLYVAPNYAAQIDGAIAQTMPRGHYWVTGQGDQVAQADYFTQHLHAFSKTDDILALDNEVLDSNGEFWTDAKVASWINRVKSNLGISGDRIYFYVSASPLRTNSWPLTIATGARLWVASWGADDGTRTDPDIGTEWPRWYIQQYWDKGPVAGYLVDRNYSPFPLTTLFGAGSSTSTTTTVGTVSHEYIGTYTPQ